MKNVELYSRLVSLFRYMTSSIVDDSGFEALFREHCQGLVRFANRFTRDVPAAENVVQEVFLKVWRDRARLQDADSIKAYLYTAVRNEALKYVRHADVERRSVPELKLTHAAVLTPEEEFQNKTTAEFVHDAIERLPDRRRLIFTMNRFDRLTYVEIAQALKISIKTVETQMGRALAFLRTELIQDKTTQDKITQACRGKSGQEGL